MRLTDLCWFRPCLFWPFELSSTELSIWLFSFVRAAGICCATPESIPPVLPALPAPPLPSPISPRCASVSPAVSWSSPCRTL